MSGNWEAVLVLVGVLAMYGGLIWILRRPPVIHVAAPSVSVEAPKVNVESPFQMPARKGEPITIRLMNESETVDLGFVTVDPSRRRPSMETRSTDGVLGQFVASHVEQPSGQWVYRRVGIARES